MKSAWSWPAFFATFAWLRSRRRHALSWLYFFVSTPVLLAAWIGWAAAGPDACLRALDPGPDLVVSALIGLIALGWVLPPLFAARVGGDPPKGRYLGSLFLQVLPLAFTAVAAPSYGNYVTRSKVSEGISLAASLKTPLAEYLVDKGRLPARAEEIAGTTKGKYTSALWIGRDGTIKAVFGGELAGKLAGRSVLMVPRIEGLKMTDWTCRSDDLPDVCVPASCRKAK
jgi:type IV pilus assembly protein PilA